MKNQLILLASICVASLLGSCSKNDKAGSNPQTDTSGYYQLSTTAHHQALSSHDSLVNSYNHHDTAASRHHDTRYHHHDSLYYHYHGTHHHDSTDHSHAFHHQLDSIHLIHIKYHPH